MLEKNDGPELVVDMNNLAEIDNSPSTMTGIPGSRMFEISKSLKIFTAGNPDEPVYDASQGDGGASLPGVPVEILESAQKMQISHGTAYDQPYGCDEFRKALVENYWKIDSDINLIPQNFIACQGGRDGLIKAYDAIVHLGHKRRGDFIITSRIPWISYNWGPYEVGENVMLAPGNEEEGWCYTQESLKQCVKHAENLGRKISAIIVTTPDNPTGNYLTEEEQSCIADWALSLNIPFIIFDWMYHFVSDSGPYNINKILRKFSVSDRKRMIFMDGITKSLGASNIRNAHLIASEDVIKFISNRASHGVIPSYYSQAIAITSYKIGFEKACKPIRKPTSDSRRLLRELLAKWDITNIIGEGYYAFINVKKWIVRAGMKDSSDMGKALGEKFGIAIVPGIYFSKYGSDWIRFSYALPPEKTKAAAMRLKDALENLV